MNAIEAAFRKAGLIQAEEVEICWGCGSQQAARPFPADYDQQVEAVYRRYSSEQLARQRAIVRCKGGE